MPAHLDDDQDHDHDLGSPRSDPGGGRAAVVLLSGGLDSATTLAIAVDQGFAAHALSFRYGQRHTIEIDAARRVADAMGASAHLIADLTPGVFTGSALTGGPEVPEATADTGTPGGPIPATYVPARNTVFLAHALAWAEVLGATDLFIGVTAVDFSGYPDCRPEFVEAFETLANLATRTGVEGRRIRVHAPLVHLSKADIIRTGLALDVDYALTHSCYDPTPVGACGRCESCVLRLRGFARAGIPDPVPYA